MFQRRGAVFGQKNFVILRKPPLHLGTDFLVVVNNQQFWFHLIFNRSGQQDAKGRALVQFTLHFNFAVMRFDNHFALKHPDANALFFGGLKRAEQASAE